MKRRLVSILTALALCLSLLPAMAWAAEGGGADVNCNAATSDIGDLSRDGYKWDKNNKTLTLNGCTLGTVTLPWDAVTVDTQANSTINKLEIAKNGLFSEKSNLTFNGPGLLTITEYFMNGVDNDTFTVAAGARVRTLGGFGVGGSGAVNGIVTVNGTLTAESGDASSYALTCGKVHVGSTGVLKVSGKEGLRLVSTDPIQRALIFKSNRAVASSPIAQNTASG